MMADEEPSHEQEVSSSAADDLQQPVLLDSLPYIDYFPEDYESYALSLIEEEMKSTKPKSNYLSHLPPYTAEPRLLGPLSQLEYQNLVAREGQPRPVSEQIHIVLAKYAASQPPAGPLLNDEHAWKLSLRSAKIEFEKQRSRQLNLELQQYYESDQWRLHTSTLTEREERMKKVVEEQQMRVDAINNKRKDMQEGAASKLARLTQRYHELIQRNHRLQHATVELEQDVKRIKMGLGMDKDDENKEDRSI